MALLSCMEKLKLRLSGATGCSRKIACVMIPKVPNEPVASLGRSYPATFFTTFPPLLARVPSGKASVMPMIRSRKDPKRVRSGPLSFVARIPPTVARSGHKGSSAAR